MDCQLSFSHHPAPTRLLETKKRLARKTPGTCPCASCRPWIVHLSRTHKTDRCRHSIHGRLFRQHGVTTTWHLVLGSDDEAVEIDSSSWGKAIFWYCIHGKNTPFGNRAIRTYGQMDNRTVRRMVYADAPLFIPCSISNEQHGFNRCRVMQPPLPRQNNC
jgi:hypothetical protein